MSFLHSAARKLSLDFPKRFVSSAGRTPLIKNALAGRLPRADSTGGRFTFDARKAETEDRNDKQSANGQSKARSGVSPELLALTDLRFPAAWFPSARSVQREIHLHVGPTNSGKTYSALQKLSTAKKGIYLAPLRLLAHEVFSRFNAAGTPCNLLTGEMQRIVSAEASLWAATVEMCPLNKEWDIAVIDECQLIGDTYRGSAWTAALLGLRAKEIHLCGDYTAVNLITRILAGIDQAPIIHNYTRLSPLSVARRSLEGDLTELKRGDCLVTFSRTAIYSLKRMVESKTSLKCAVIYGSLPPETRNDQARLFNQGQYDVLVASDAVGMGLNLNIGRIIFEKTRKFNGSDVVPVPVSQIKQIAGRAGRFNSDFADGVVTTLYPRDGSYVKQCVGADLSLQTRAGLAPTLDQVRVLARQCPNDKFSEVLGKFQDLATLEGNYFLCNLEEQMEIADLIEDLDLTIEDRYILVLTPVSLSIEGHKELLVALARAHATKTHITIRDVISVFLRVPTSPELLMKWEFSHKSIIAYLWLSYRFPKTFKDLKGAMYLKTCVEAVIEEALETMDFSKKKKKVLRQPFDTATLATHPTSQPPAKKPEVGELVEALLVRKGIKEEDFDLVVNEIVELPDGELLRY